MLDGKPAVGNHQLFQIGQNPFEPGHATQLRHMLKFLAANVQSGNWRVSSNGVSKQAIIFGLQDVDDSEEAELERYIVLLEMYLNLE